MKHAVLVCGIARSGTSAVSGALAAAGLPFGDGLKPRDWQNPNGNHEDAALSDLNTEILALFGMSWSTDLPLPEGWVDRPDVIAIVKRMEAEFEARFGDLPIFGLKDPRLVPLFALYARFLRDLGRQIHVITVSRNRREVLASIRKSGYYHRKFTVRRGRRLYRYYMTQIDRLRVDPGSQHVTYDALLADPTGTVERLIAGLPMAEVGLVPDVAAGAAFIDRALWRNRRPSLWSRLTAPFEQEPGA